MKIHGYSMGQPEAGLHLEIPSTPRPQMQLGFGHAKTIGLNMDQNGLRLGRRPGNGLKCQL